MRRRLEQRRRRVGNFVVNFVSQSLQQELLFFSLPLLIGATQLDAGQSRSRASSPPRRVLTTIDPLYERLVATRAARRMTFHAFCSWIAALVVLPMVLLAAGRAGAADLAARRRRVVAADVAAVAVLAAALAQRESHGSPA